MTTSDPGSPAIATGPGLALDGSGPVSANPATAVFGQVMGLVAATIGFLAAGAYIGRDLNPGLGIVFFLGAFACIFGLNIASSRGSRQLASTLLFGLGLLLGLALGPVLSAYANVDPAALWQAAGATAASVAALGALGYAVRRDLSSWARTLLWALVALIVFGIVAIFASIPHANVIYAVAGLAIFGAFTVFDFNRLRRTGVQDAIPIAASIFLDIFNVFLLFLQLFGGERD
jgi:FtsH-binding integral membrane protein